MEADIIEQTEPSELVLSTLSQHLPYSLPTLRRLQFMKASGCQTSDQHVLSTFYKEPPGKNFLVSYLDLSKGPETEMWLYSSIENTTIPGCETACEQQILNLFARAREIEHTFHGQRATPGIVLVGTLHKRVLHLLEKHSLVKTKTEEHTKFIFKMQDLPVARQLPVGLSWSSIRASDIPIVLSRTIIPYKAASMKLLPSVAIEPRAGNPVAWAFLGPDGSLKTLYCEEEYRGRGFAKAVALRLFHQRSADFAEDGLYHADVAVENHQSQGVCRSLKGSAGWSIYWAWVDISKA